MPLRDYNRPMEYPRGLTVLRVRIGEAIKPIMKQEQNGANWSRIVKGGSKKMGKNTTKH